MKVLSESEPSSPIQYKFQLVVDQKFNLDEILDKIRVDVTNLYLSERTVSATARAIGLKRTALVQRIKNDSRYKKRKVLKWKNDIQKYQYE